MSINTTTTPALLSLASERYGDRPFIEDGNRSWSFTAFRDACYALAAGLVNRGFKMGDRAAIWAPNMAEWAIAALGVHCAGGILVTLNTRYKGNEAAYVLNASKATHLFCVGQFLGLDYPAMLDTESLPHLQHVIRMGSASSSQQTIAFDALLEEGRAALAANPAAFESIRNAVAGSDISDILFTSGTTGEPKGVIAAHEQNLEAFRIWGELLGLTAQDRYLIVNPFFHSFGFKAGILASLIQGATILPHSVFDAHAIMVRIAAEKISVLPGPPTLFQSLLDHPDRSQHDLSSLQRGTTGAAVIPVTLIRRIREELGLDNILTAYGLTECGGLATMCRYGDSDEIIATTSGRAIPGLELRCVDHNGQAVPVGESGEVTLRGFNIMKGYLDRPDATREAIDEQGWLHTGDIGVLDEQGNLRITDRLKDMYICGGFNCYPAEIENVLSGHPAVSMAAVIGIPDERMGEVGMAWLVAAPGASLDTASLHDWCRERMANFKVPRSFRVVDALPLNASGKVLKTELRERAASK